MWLIFILAELTLDDLEQLVAIELSLHLRTLITSFYADFLVIEWPLSLNVEGLCGLFKHCGRYWAEFFPKIDESRVTT